MQMRAHLVQLDIRWEDKPSNYETVRGLLSGANAREGDLVVLPEMFDTGFSLRTEETADENAATLAFLGELARSLHVWIHGGRTMAGRAGLATNRATILDPQGRLVAEYSKIHPFTYGREPERFRPGTEVITYDWVSDTGSLRICPAICYDLRFPELFREGLARGAEAFVIGANWPDARHAHWRALLIARAIENQAYVLGVNRVGNDPYLAYAGGSMGVSPKGEVIGELGAEAGVLTVDVDPGAVRAWRGQFPAWRDARLHEGLARLRDRTTDTGSAPA